MMSFQVEGMSCNHCVAAITRSVQQVDPSARVHADVAAKSVQVESTAAEPSVRAAIESAGYTVKS
ncbi:heavy-metal-associated domain-containing protein [Cupriavidus sp. AU9028]|uniref:heavy-metal-associated domain-containing protein n=1 Tax=Cupriavidus sp. AU9028 TaxID=2871157 RepID=UPI001C980D75|nr:heavy-metal-associated domain-containing protein [Cupriavidus sp. AU9028]MBY4897684.1 heavy-metal-associated domain-containing protein [Cupriavidus sp. AU9028]